MKVNTVCIYEDADLRVVLQNAYYDGEKSRFFSILSKTKTLELYGNKTVEDMTAYINGTYDFNDNWCAQRLNQNMKIVVYDVDDDVIERLKRVFNNVTVINVRTVLKAINVIKHSC